ncbi:exodeoxyribonuclease VII large subunit [Adhaeribacter rhizoryzae]|uniref:Exodeoxyribonuclease 7 large subunit n=1 Tax=Adhaeribacter rhizoryzae TaxID=2607907 RepID=A0A5M6DK88_9BACT|nr:exodeoxyribonuclease VII large subunit [Adhaeribacter rhizoryzae]KAA5547964.1 exodeoxyribonuclease VII large subunit [Adhaeribacter rhizoryzae]
MIATANPIRLSQLNQLIQFTLEDAFQEQRFGVIAETTNISLYPNKNQCYLTLIEKCEQTDRVVASMKARIWGNSYKCIQCFEETTGQHFKDNIQILLKVRVNYHVQYGLSLEIEDIDPNYTIGRLALSRQAVIQKLLTDNPDHIWEQNGEFITHNKSLTFPPVIQRIALISSAQADGYADFMHELYTNRYGFSFTVDEYLAPVQGLDAHKAIYQQLVRIYESNINYDAVVLVRGGGSQLDFQAYDTYLLSRAVARYHVPIITGIGHEKNESVCDLMAKLKTKTPTKAAASIVAHNQSFNEKLLQLQKQLVLKTNEILISQELILNECRTTISSLVKDLLNQEQRFLSTQMNAAVLLTEKRLQQEKMNLLKLKFNLSCNADNRLKEENFRLRHYLQSVNHLDPQNILKRGYAIVYKHGKAVTNLNTLQAGDKIKTRFYAGEVESQVLPKTTPNESGT